MKIFILIIFLLGLFPLHIFAQSSKKYSMNSTIAVKTMLENQNGSKNESEKIDEIKLKRNILSLTSNLSGIKFKNTDNLITNKINEILEFGNNLNNKTESNSQSKSFFKSNWFYFIGAAVLAVTAYLFLSSKEKSTINRRTFGIPPVPGK